ncbi:MAG: hypothetical protein NZ891_04050 [bacterium]|nr:hypothetical protein [bacterium]MDW8163896.1 hypothetical protein [Candidatus Omnitrophota bacterium]
MKKTKIILTILFLFYSLSFSDEIIDNFFLQIKNLKEKGQSLRIESIETKISGEIIFSEEGYKALKNLIYKIFQKDLPRTLKIDGYLKGKCSPEKDTLEFDLFYLYLTTNIDNFALFQTKENIYLIIPSLGIMAKESRENIKKTQKNEKKESLPANFFHLLFALIEKENEIKQNIQFVKEGKRDNFKTYNYTYSFPDGIIEIEIFDSFYTFSQLKIQNNKEKTELILIYSLPEKEIKISSYLPSAIKIQAEKDANRLILNFADIKYNKISAEDEFKLKEISFQELFGFILFKSIIGK